MHKPNPTPSPGERDYSDKDIPIGTILLGGLYITIFTILSFVGVRFLFLYLNRSNEQAQQTVSAYASQRSLPAEPRLQVDEPRTWQHQLAVEKAQTEEYAWVDQKAGLVRIPVERAMEVVAGKGLPARSEAKP